VPHADFVTSTTHKTLRGPRGGFVLCREEFARRLDSALFPGIQGGPMMHSIAAKAVAFKLAMTEEFRAYQKQVVANAAAMAEELAQAGFKIVSGGTDNHLFLVNLIGRPMNGKEASRMLGRAHITVNHNAVPRDPLPPMKTSGIRVGSPALTTRGLKEDDARQVARLIARVLDGEGADEVIADARAAVLDLCERFPIPH
jgi:glycine hydroxymethyltransferase